MKHDGKEKKRATATPLLGTKGSRGGVRSVSSIGVKARFTGQWRKLMMPLIT